MNGCEKDSELSLARLCSLLELDEAHVLCVYQYGSRVYGTAAKGADWDVTVVVEDGCRASTGDRIVVVGNVDGNLFSRSEFILLLQQHDMRALVCLFLPAHHVWKQSVDFALSFTLDQEALRNSVWTISNKAFGYANICEREGLPRKAKKNLVHSVRFLLYGIQLAKDGRISDYAAANHYYRELFPIRDDQEEEREEEREKEREAKGEKTEEEAKEKGEWAKLRKLYKGRVKELNAEFERILGYTGVSEGRLLRRLKWHEKMKEKRRERRFNGGSGKMTRKQKKKAKEREKEKERGENEEKDEEEAWRKDMARSANVVLYYEFYRSSDI